MAFNALMFPHVPFDNLNAQVHRHALPKALCQLNITRITRRLSSVCRSDNHPSGLIFFLFFAQVGHFYVLALVGSFLSLAHYQPWLVVGPFWILVRCQSFLKFSSLSALARCRPLLKFSSLSA